MEKEKRRLLAYCILPAVLLLGLVLTTCGKQSETDFNNQGNALAFDKAVPMEDGLICLNGENNYTIVYDDKCGKMVEDAVKKLQEYLGIDLKVADDETAESTDCEILLGQTNRPESVQIGEGLGENDYRIAVENEKLILAGGSDTALINAIAVLMRDEDAVTATDDGSLVIAMDYHVSFDGADSREDYIENPDLFLCNWILKFDVPEWMLDFEEKIAAFNDPDGRMMAMFHRGDWYHYPENSIEGIISAIKMGADCIEVDLRLTRDGVVVLMHDETLTRTTDWAEKAGKNGLPESPRVSDWTYEELCQLRLKKQGLYIDSNSEQAAEYCIPTFEEVLRVCSERAILWLDKDDAWDWNTDVYPIIRELGAWRTCLSCNYGVSGQDKIIVDTIKTESDHDALILHWVEQSECANWKELLDSYVSEGYSPMLGWISFDSKFPKYSIETVGTYLEQIKDDVRIFAFVHALEGGAEKPETWDYLYENGIDFVAVDYGLGVQKYIAENFSATGIN